MNLASRPTKVLPYAHLFGVRAPAASAAVRAKPASAKKAEEGDKDDEQREGESDQDYADCIRKKSKAAGYREGFAAASERAAKVITSQAAQGNPHLAANLLRHSDMTASQVIETLTAAGPTRAGRSAHQDTTSPAGVAALVIAAGKKARGEA